MITLCVYLPPPPYGDSSFWKEENRNSTAYFNPSYIVSGLVYIFPYLKVTLGLTVSSVCLGTFWALFFAFLELRSVPLFKELAALYVLICRSLPNMVLLYLVYYGLPIFVMA